MPFAVGLNLIVFAGLVFALVRFMATGASLSRQVLTGLLAGLAFGCALQAVYGAGSEAIAATLQWTDVAAAGYVSLLKMIVMPLILVSMTGAVLRIGGVRVLGRIGSAVIGLLVATTIVAALIGIGVTHLFGLSAEGLTSGARELARAEVLQQRLGEVSGLSFADVLISFFPTNIFADLAGARPTSIIAVVIFSMLAGIAGLRAGANHPERAHALERFMDLAQVWVMKLVRIVLALTPFGILALMTRVIATSSPADILALAGFVAASYVAIALMFAVHLGLLTLASVNLGEYIRQVWPVLVFAFGSRSSAATIPLNIQTQTERLGVPPSIANLSASFGSTIGQNGCAGIYPAMLAVMTAPTVGVDPLTPAFVLGLLAVVAISSFGVAGVGGGATFAALMVLPAMGLPVTLAALLISIEPLIDMARTALNVNGSITAGVITSRVVSLPEAAAESKITPA